MATDVISPPGVYPPEIPQRPTSSLGAGPVFLTSDLDGRLEIACRKAVVGSVWRWIAAAFVLMAGLTLERHLQCRPKWILALCQWPHAVGIGVGIVWWSLLTPSAVGLLIVVLTLLSLGLTLWRKSHPPHTASLSTQLTARVGGVPRTWP